MHYFFIEGASLAGGQVVELLPEDVNHVYRVLRLTKGAPVYIGDGLGMVFRGNIVAAGPRSVKVYLEQPVPSAEPPLNITLLQSLSKGEKMDLIVRQSTELGVSRIIPVVTGHSIPNWGEDKERRRLARWQSIARSAASQCRRGRIPAIEPVANFSEALDVLPSNREGLTVVPWEDEKRFGVKDIYRQAFPPGGSVFLFIGPEGGFSESEIDALSVSGAVTVHLGPRILRTETAAAVSLALVQAAWGDLGGEHR